MIQTFAIFKPYGVLSQFTKEYPDHRVLSEFYDFPKDVYPIGRLDRDSEGLLLLTNDNHLKTRLLDPKRGHKRTYLVQVEGNPTLDALQQLRSGVEIRINKKSFHTKPAEVRLLSHPPALPDRDPPVRYRQHIPTSWLELRLTEGKNRQVRRMTAKVGFPTLRLVRSQFDQITIEGRKLGEVWEISKDVFSHF